MFFPHLAGDAARLVPDLGEVTDDRAGVQILNDPERARIRVQLRYARRLVVDVAEDDRLCRTGLLACRPELAVAKLAMILVLRAVLGLRDALDAEGALFHDPAGADRDIRIPHQVHRAFIRLPVIEEVEAADFIR